MNTHTSNTRPAYGNWVPGKVVGIFSGTAIFFLLLAAATFLPFSAQLLGQGALLWVVRLLLVLLIVATTGTALTFGLARKSFADDGGRMMRRVISFVVDMTDARRSGRALDVGCGSGMLTIALAKRVPSLQVVGTDYWSGVWDYGKEQCEKNAAAEGVASRTCFMAADAASLPFEDKYFDLVVSNFVLHEVKTQPNKLLLIDELLRVLKPGGQFVLHDLFFQHSLYGKPEKIVAHLKQYCQEVELIPTSTHIGLPAYMNTPLLLKGVGMLKGVK